jgi:hypothetical protein
VDEFTEEELRDFLATPFIHHYNILVHADDLAERLFYIHKCARALWTKEHFTYRSSAELPEQYRNILPTADELRKLL